MNADAATAVSSPGDAAGQHTSDLSRLIVAWQHPVSRLISPVGLLDFGDQSYRFRYYRQALTTPDFRPFVGFPDLHLRYSSTELFPFFQQRVMHSRRPDYLRYIRSLALPANADPWEQLARSGGRRSGDTIQLFPEPRVAADGHTECIFLVHGVRHIERAYDSLVQRRIDKLERGDQLSLSRDSENPVNSEAVFVCTLDGHPLGWVPNLLLDYIHSTGQMPGLRITVEHTNGEEAPYHFRLIVKLEGRVPSGYMPFTGPDWEFLSDD